MSPKPKIIVSFTLHEETLVEIDRASRAMGCSRSKLVEKAVQRILTLPEFKKAIASIEKIQKEVNPE